MFTERLGNLKMMTSSHSSKNLNKQKRSVLCNVVVALRNRSTKLNSWNSAVDLLHSYGEMCAATLCDDNRKADLAQGSRSTFMTAFSPNCELIASCHGDHNVHVTNIQTGKVVTSLVGHERSPWCISFHPTSNEILATGCLNGEVRVWDLRGGGSESWTNQSEHATITSISFHPIDHILLIASGNGIYFWDWKLPKPFAFIKTNSSFEKVRLVRFEAHGSRILTGIVNSEEEEEEEDGLLAGIPSSSNARGENVWEPWLSSSPFSPSLRVSSSRPLTAPFNLRGRHARLTPSSESPSSSNNEQSTRCSLRQRVSDVSHSHTYSRDHRRILRARVSVQAEIQHQYNRLQQLRRERRRLEDRLRQLQTNRVSLRSGERSSALEDRGLQNDLHALEREAFIGYNEINEVISSRLQTQVLQPPLPPPEPPSPLTSRSLTFSEDVASSGPLGFPLVEPVDPASLVLFGSLPSSVLTVPPVDSGIRPSNESSSSRRLRRTSAVRRPLTRRRSFFNHVWPVPESPHSSDRVSYRLQWWDFDRFEMPEISRSDVNMVVRHCKIHNDSSVDVSKDSRMVAALIWLDGSSHAAEVGVFSLLSTSLGTLLYRHSVDTSQYAVCLSLSPLGNYLAVGLKYYIIEGSMENRKKVAQILKLKKRGDSDMCIPVFSVKHPGREMLPHRPPSINTISWLPHVGWGLVYGTNDGQLRFCFTKPLSA